MKEHNNQIYFVQILEPEEIKRNILETLRNVLEELHRFEKFKAIRHEKLGDINNLRKSFRDVNKLFGSLKAKLPQVDTRVTEPKPVQEKKPQNKVKLQEKPQKAPKKQMTEMEKLESELSVIENKLKELA